MADTPLTIVLVTSSYPFGTDEEFPAEEALRWPLDHARFVVVPLVLPGPANPVPAGVVVDTRLADHRTRRRKLVSTAVALVHPLLLREAVTLARRRALTPRRLLDSARVIGQTLLVRDGLRRILADLGPRPVLYSYWHSPATYAGVLLRREGRVRSVVSRGHGSDLYEAATAGGWHPLKRQLGREVEHTWTVSGDGARELVERYGVDPARVSVARLGVPLPPAVGPEPGDDVLRVLSVSTCTPLKRVPSIARAVARVASRRPDAVVEWTHLGSGPGLEELRALAADLRRDAPNLTVVLPGFVAHDDVLAHLAQRPVDVLVNASTTEGVPVSIMEAMAFGIPVVAPAVGGVPELVDGTTGWLLETVTEETLADAIGEALDERPSSQRRSAARARVEERFDAARTYGDFAEDLLRRVGRPSA